MTDFKIPPGSMTRLRASIEQTNQLGAVIAEAMGIDPQARYSLDLQRGVFVVEDEQMTAPVPANGVAEVATA